MRIVIVAKNSVIAYSTCQTDVVRSTLD